MRTLFCTVVLTFTVLAAPAATAWEVPVSKAALVSWQELLAAVASWFGDGEMGPLIEPEGMGPLIDPEGMGSGMDLERLGGWFGSDTSPGIIFYGDEDEPNGEMGPYVDPEG